MFEDRAMPKSRALDISESAGRFRKMGYNMVSVLSSIVLGEAHT